MCFGFSCFFDAFRLKRNLLKLERFPDSEASIRIKEEHRKSCDPTRIFLEEAYEEVAQTRQKVNNFSSSLKPVDSEGFADSVRTELFVSESNYNASEGRFPVISSEF